MTKPRLTLEEHEELGRTLAAIHNELVHRVTQLANAYPRSGVEGEPYRKLRAAEKALNQARAELDHALFRDHPQAGETTMYYPHPEDRSVNLPTTRSR
ncbi:hypothetical protein ADL07_11765 [Streptomyces sp. NRRL F-4707]|uniref:hypothetical protein n=1 Tax=Streptomyces sp. NRRL F-4707 TaxID=1519496 RepID=UPI0006ADA36E|nr:hypothetical protein [Streptomyces sp. NRRL F-4707]KOX32832.1 hypothetical protein ADL07_11765 [Streptomyces sp. NRRL F-4707]